MERLKDRDFCLSDRHQHLVWGTAFDGAVSADLRAFERRLIKDANNAHIPLYVVRLSEQSATIRHAQWGLALMEDDWVIIDHYVQEAAKATGVLLEWDRINPDLWWIV